MKVSTRARYGLRALLDLAMRWEQGPVQLKDIAKNQGVSLQYLEHLMKPLISAGLIRSMRGTRGGVWLARSPQEIKLNEIMQALIGSMAPVECVDDPLACDRSKQCATRDVWYEMKIAVDSVLQSTTLKDLAARQLKKEHTTTPMYYI